MSGGIYLIREGDTLVEMKERTYDSESILQELLARYPHLLAGDQMNADNPRRWLLVTQEAGLASEDDGSDRWSVDHLFLDQDAVPTLVEVKRSSDTRIRREVVGQMLDYAANSVLHWPIDKVTGMFEADCERRGVDADQVLAEFLGSDTQKDPEQFWQTAKTNLQAGRVRLVFVADVIPSELRRVVEFLNRQMDPAEVLAVEIRQYVGQGLKTLVPRVIGQLERQAESQAKRQWDEASFLRELGSRNRDGELPFARRALDWAKERGLRVRWGKGKVTGSASLTLDTPKRTFTPISLWTSGAVQVEFQLMTAVSPFDSEEKRKELANKLNQIPNISIPAGAIARWPYFPMDRLKDSRSADLFFQALDWVVAEVRQAQA